MLRLAVLVSGGGTNLQAILDAIDEGTITNAEVSVVISNNAGAYALERAKKKEIDAVCLSPKTFASREAFNEALLAKLQSYNVDLVVLAGCLVVIPQSIVDAYPNKIINIHPSLIPSFCGTGYYGLKVHEGVLSRGVKVTGATVHFVDGGTDTGPIILQKAVEVHEGDTPKALQQRVMEDKQTAMQGVYIYCAKKVQKIAEILGDTAKAEELAKEAEEKTAAVRKYLLDEKTGLFVSGEEKQINYASQVWLILAGAVSIEEGSAMLDKLDELKPEKGMVSPYMNHHYVEALLMCGKKDQAMEYMKYYWGGMISHGADTFWELYNPENPAESPYGSSIVNSYCHAWSCTPTYLLRKYFN